MEVDMELKKAFAELQEKMLHTQQQLQVADAQIETQQRNIKQSQMYGQELDTLPDNIESYKSVQRMFIMTPLEDLKTDLRSTISQSEARIKALESNKKYLERSFKDAENNLRETVSQRQQARNT